MNGLNGKAAQAEFFVAANFDQLGGSQQAMLIQLVFDQADGQACGVHRHGALAQKIRQAADMVFVAVGDDHALDLFTVLLDKSEIGDHQINAVHILIGEDGAAVHQQHIAPALVQGDVFAHFAQTAQRINVQLGALFVRCRAAGALGARGALGRQLFLGRRLGLGSRRCARGANGRLTGRPGSHFGLLGGAGGLFALLGLCLGLGCGLCRLGALGLTGFAAIVAAGGLFIGAAGLCSRGLFFHIAHSSSKRAAAKNAPAAPSRRRAQHTLLQKGTPCPRLKKTDKKTAQKSACAAKKARRLGWASRYVVCKQPKKKMQEVSAN